VRLCRENDWFSQRRRARAPLRYAWPQAMTIPRYIRQHRKPMDEPYVRIGELVVATRYSDGDPADAFCVGFYNGFYVDRGEKRHLVVDGKGKSFRAKGFRRVAPVGKQRGAWILHHLPHIEEMKDRYSVWHWYRAPWRELRALDAPP
jgi:hypothetical protein